MNHEIEEMHKLDERILQAAKRALTETNKTVIQEESRSLLSIKAELRAEQIIEVERIVLLLNEGQYFGAFTFALPFQILSSYIFCYLSGRNF